MRNEMTDAVGALHQVTDEAAPRFSVLVPAFNAARYIAVTLHSVRKQGHASVEVIVMDGGSTDGTVEIARGFPGLNIRVISESDRGQLDALQKAIRLARGDILHWLNADDIMMPGTLHEVDKTFLADPELDLVFSDDFAFDEDRRLLANGGLIKGLSYKDHVLFYRQMCSECIFWRREKSRLLPDTDYDLRVFTDYAFFLNMRSGLKERWLRKRLGAFRIAENQASQRFRERYDAEFSRIRSRAYADAGWSARKVRLMRVVHWPSFQLRQVMRPKAHAGVRALKRFLDRGARRHQQTEAFFDRWLVPEYEDVTPLTELLYR